MKEHKDHTKTFRELDCTEQSKSITAQINNLHRQIVVHLQMCTTNNSDIDERVDRKSKIIDQLNNMIKKI